MTRNTKSMRAKATADERRQTARQRRSERKRTAQLLRTRKTNRKAATR